MIRVTLRYKWITWAMFMGPGQEPVLPSGRRYRKKMYTYHLDRAPWSLTKTHRPLCIIEKRMLWFPEIFFKWGFSWFLKPVYTGLSALSGFSRCLIPSVP